MGHQRGIYTDNIVKVVERMLRNGASNEEIAETIGTTPERLKVRMSQIGLKREPKLLRTDLTLKFPPELASKYLNAAHRRNMTVRNFVFALLDRVAQDDLFKAILDDEK